MFYGVVGGLRRRQRVRQIWLVWLGGLTGHHHNHNNYSSSHNNNNNKNNNNNPNKEVDDQNTSTTSSVNNSNTSSKSNNKKIKGQHKRRGSSSETSSKSKKPPPPPPVTPPSPLYNNNINNKMSEHSPKTPGSSSHTPGSSHGAGGLSLMENLLGLLRIRIKRGVNLAVRDVRSSDPYVVVKMGGQDVYCYAFAVGFLAQILMLIRSSVRLKTRVIKHDVNPEWMEDLTLSVTDPNLPVKLTVYDHDTFSKDDKMGDAEFDISPYIEALRMNLSDLPSGTVITKVHPHRNNCLSEESSVMWSEGRVIQDVILRLRNVECGELEIQLQWIDLPGSKGL
ncbi:hypothetical protein ACFE04_008932 [Oxalis oulophora]